MRGKCSTWKTLASFCAACAALGASQCHFVTWSTSVSFCVTGAALGAPQCRFAWQVHLEDLSVILRGTCSTWTSSREVCGSPATIEYYGRRLLLCGRCSTWSTSVSVCVAPFCVAGAALGACQCHFAWQVQHLEHLSVFLRGRCSTRSTSVSFCGGPRCHFARQVQHLEPSAAALGPLWRCSECCPCHAK